MEKNLKEDERKINCNEPIIFAKIKLFLYQIFALSTKPF